MAASDAPNQTSPKVKAIDKVGGLLVVGIAVVAFILSGITPDLFPALGAWAPLIAGAAVFGGARLAAWNAADPLRDNTLTQAKAIAGAMVRDGVDDPDVVAPEPGRYDAVQDTFGRYEAGRPGDNTGASATGTDLAAENWPKTNKG